MISWQIPGAPAKGWLPLILLSILTLVSLIISIVLVNLGLAIIFVPIILACMYYAKRGFVFSVFLVCIYFFLTITLSSDLNVLQIAAIRAPVFILVAGVITYLSLQRTRVEEGLLKKTEELHAAYEELTASEEELRHNLEELTLQEQALRESDERYRLINDASLDYIYSYDKAGRFTSANRSLCDAMRLRNDQILGRTHIELGFPDAQCRDWDELHRRVYKTDTTVTAFTSTPMPDGTIRQYEVVLNPLHDSAGTIAGIAGTTRDITERKRAEDALIESEERYRYLFDSAPDGITVIDEKGIIVGCSQRNLDVTGYTKEELLGKHITYDILLSSKGVFSEKFPSLQQNKPVEGEIQIARKDGSVVWIWRKGFPLPDRAGKFSGALLYDRDVTERKLAEDTLRRVNHKLHVLSQLTRKDLTNQIFVLSSYLELTNNQLSGQDHIIHILEKGFEAVRSIHKTIEYSKDYQDIGAKPPKWQNVRMALLFGLSHISISEIKHSLETGDVEIFADPLLEKVCQRLFENSVKHGGHVTMVRVWYTVTPNGATIVFEDDGIGIPQEKKEQIFSRGDGTRASMNSLIFVREILDITGITIAETGEPGKGARFEMAVPKGMWRMAGDGD